MHEAHAVLAAKVDGAVGRIDSLECKFLAGASDATDRAVFGDMLTSLDRKVDGIAEQVASAAHGGVSALTTRFDLVEHKLDTLANDTALHDAHAVLATKVDGVIARVDSLE